MNVLLGNRAKLLGLRFGTILVLEELDCTPQHGVRWLCQCDCGNRLVKETRALRRGKHSSCYSCNSARKSAQFKVHGETLTTDGPRTALYKTWCSMRERCNKPTHPAYHCYGGKGVSVCKEWNSYPAFKVWAEVNGYQHRPDLPLGDRPSIDRIDPSGDYCPENCRIIRHRDNAKKHKFQPEAKSVH